MDNPNCLMLGLKGTMLGIGTVWDTRVHLYVMPLTIHRTLRIDLLAMGILMTNLDNAPFCRGITQHVHVGVLG